MKILSREKIKEVIPYDEPFLFVDKVERIEDNRISGLYQTAREDEYFKGHFVDFPIMPGVLIVEALAQLSTILLRLKIGVSHRRYHLLAYDVKSAQFYKPIFPGDKIALHAEIAEMHEDRIALVQAEAFVNKELKCKTVFSVAIIRKDKFEAKYLVRSGN